MDGSTRHPPEIYITYGSRCVSLILITVFNERLNEGGTREVENAAFQKITALDYLLTQTV